MRSLAFLLAVGCGGGEGSTPKTDASPSTAPSPTTTAPATPAACPETDPTTVTVTTRDGVALVGDLYAGKAGEPGFVLLHMIPPSNDRTNWPVDFVHRLQAKCWTVLVLDRRGAGDSAGVALDAYTGENGKYDVEAAVKRLGEAQIGPLAILGASNGTTSMIDYAIWAPTQGLPQPVALGFMTGGTYTENQNAMSAVPKVPAVFTYSTEERDWSVAQQPLDPGTWSFLEYPHGAHGTLMFDAAPKVKGDLVDFFAGVFDPGTGG